MTTSLLPSLVALVAVVLMIPAALWLVKRSQALRVGGAGPLSVITGVALGPRERIVVVRAADRVLVVGLTAQSMSLLATLDEWPAGDPSPAVPPSFSALLERVNRNVRKDS